MGSQRSVFTARMLPIVLAIALCWPAIGTAEQHTVWTKRASGTTNHLSSCCFVDEKNGWAVGNNRTILHTADAGKTWVKQTSPAVGHLYGVDFWDKNIGWAVGFKEISVEPTIVYGAVILKTANGGATWVQQSHPDPVGRWLEDVVALSATRAYAVGGNSGVAGKNIVKTEDGTNWTAEDFSPAANLFNIWAWRPNDYVFQAAAVGFPNTAIDNFSVGSVWEQATNPTPYPNALLLSIAEGYTGTGPSAVRTWIAVGDDSALNEATGTILRATDLMTPNWSVIAPPTTKQLRGVASARSQQWWVVGTLGAVYYSNTGGTSWKQQTSPAGTASVWDVAVTKKDGKPIAPGSSDVFHGDDYLIAVGTNGLIMTGKRPLVTLAAPILPAVVKKGVSFAAYGYVKPWHSGTTAIDFEWYNPTTLKWGRIARVAAKNANYSTYTKYTLRYTPPVAGKWRTRAVHPEDYNHAATWGAYRNFTVQ